MKKYKISIVTVCYNAEKDIEKTIVSVLQQTFHDYEYIIIDGKSQDQTVAIIEQNICNTDEKILFLSEKDNGIYDAMNKGIRIARGEYIYFLNAGDVFASNDVLRQVNGFLGEDIALAYGHVELQNAMGKISLKKQFKFNSNRYYFLLGDCVCHQSIFARKQLLELHLFNVQYSVCADKEWQLYLLFNGCRFTPIDLVISRMLIEGYSLQNVDAFEKETEECLRKYFGCLSYIYVLTKTIRKFIKSKVCVR